MRRNAWIFVTIALIVGAFIGRGGGLDVLAQATPGVTETAVVPTETAVAPTETVVAPTGTVPAGETPGTTATAGVPSGQTPVSGTTNTGAGGQTSANLLTLTVIERAVSDTVVDVGDPGDSIGDTLAFGNPVFDQTNQQQVGQSQGSCVRVLVGQLWECSFTTILADGGLSVQGPFSDTDTTILTITGGTGAYIGARGEMELSVFEDPNTDPDEYQFAFSIIEDSIP